MTQKKTPPPGKHPKRAPHSGTIERIGDRYRARLPDERRTILDVFDSYEAASTALDGYTAITHASGVGRDSLATYAPGWLDHRRHTNPKSIDRDISRWRCYMEKWECYGWPMREVKRGDVIRFVTGVHKGRADQTARNALNLLRQCFEAALDDEKIDANPAARVRVKARGTTETTWDYLRLDEQRQLLTCTKIRERDRAMRGFAIGTGLRWGEQRVLELADVHLDGDAPYVFVHRSVTKKGATKNQRHREVPLFGIGLAAARALVELNSRRHNPRGLLCVPKRGEAYLGANGPRLAGSLKAARIDRPVRWHDLRHTCASSLISGVWGRKWSLIEIRDFLGHSTITLTERYAHLAGTIVSDAAAEMSRCHPVATTDLSNYWSRLGDSNPRPTVYETVYSNNDIIKLSAKSGNRVATGKRAANR